MAIDISKTYRLAPTLHLKEDEDALLVLDAKTYAVHQLNPSAALVARLCDGKNTCEQMVASLVQQFGEELPQAAAIVYHGLSLLEEQGLLECA